MKALQAFKFDTRISENGIISLPFEPKLFSTDVEIIVLPKVKAKGKGIIKKETSAMDFFNKFSGTLDNALIDDAKDCRYNYLIKKYQLKQSNISNDDLEQAKNEYLSQKYL
jgi:hypothetical protein